MKKLLKTGVVAAIAILSVSANAAPFNYVDVSIGTIDSDGSSDNGDYSSLSASLEVPAGASITPLLSLEATDFNDSNILKVGGGASLEMGGDSYLYGLVHYNDYEGSTDSDFSITGGYRGMFTDRLEGVASYTTYTDHDSHDGFTLSLGYFLTDSFSVAGNYEAIEDANIMSVTGRLSF